MFFIIFVEWGGYSRFLFVLQDSVVILQPCSSCKLGPVSKLCSTEACRGRQWKD